MRAKEKKIGIFGGVVMLRETTASLICCFVEFLCLLVF